MAPPRPSQRDIVAARRAARQEEMEHASATGQLIVGQMTSEERAQSAGRRAKTRARDAGNQKGRGPRRHPA